MDRPDEMPCTACPITRSALDSRAKPYGLCGIGQRASCRMGWRGLQRGLRARAQQAIRGAVGMTQVYVARQIGTQHERLPGRSLGAALQRDFRRV